MRHFDLTNWVDYTRGVAAPGEKREMNRHLAEGCDACSRLAELAGRIRLHASIDLDAPSAWVKRAKAIFEPAPETAVWLPRLAATLFFGGEEWAAAGVRASAPSAGDVLCRAGDYRVELRLEREPESVEFSLVGVVNAAGGAPVPDAPVLLMGGGKAVTRTATNELGEFCLVSGARQGLKLCVQI